ncbi:MAG: hypothetical protein L3J35_03970 [Bacteroidales bacterium]|nr:hypothetical protein [Bacteroidales bacterium]
MKKKIFILLISLLFFYSDGFGQFDERNRVFKCAQFFGDSIIFLNDFDISQEKRKTKEDPNGKEWEVYLMNGTEYRFAICCDSQRDIVMKLYSDSVPETAPLKSTYINGKNMKYFDFLCNKSEVYKVSVRFKKDNVIGKELTALGILGFIRKVK